MLVNSSSGDAIQQCRHAPAALQRSCVGRHLANKNDMRVSGSDSYALLFLFLQISGCFIVIQSRLISWKSRKLIATSSCARASLLHAHAPYLAHCDFLLLCVF